LKDGEAEHRMAHDNQHAAQEGVYESTAHAVHSEDNTARESASLLAISQDLTCGSINPADKSTER
jgi:hypothetical protein